MIGRAAIVMALLVLVACGNSRGGREGYQTFAQLLKERTGQTPDPVPLTRASIGDFSDPLLHAAIPAREAESFLGLAQRNGRAETWLTQDDIAVILRDGVLIGTRGLGEDLMSSLAPEVRTARGSVLRINYYIGGDNTTMPVPFDCQIVDAGTETIDIFGETRPARRVDETCEGAEVDILNSYWFDETGKVRQSRQWVSKSVGYITLQRVID